MNQLERLTDDDLHLSTVRAARADQQAQVETVLHLIEVDRRRLHAKLGFSSLFSYAVEALGFSEPAAAQRVHAMRLTQSVAVVEDKLKSGALSLSSAASVQKFIRKEEKVSHRVLSSNEKNQIVSEVSGKSARETERILLSFASDPEPHLLKEKTIPLTLTRTQLTFVADEALMADLQRARELMGDLSLEEIFRAALSQQLERLDPVRKTSKSKAEHSPKTCELRDEKTQSTSLRGSPPRPLFQPKKNLPVSSSQKPPSRYIPRALLQALYARSGGSCEYVDQKSGRRCGSRYRLEVEHRIPFATGGSTTLDNCLHYCKTHNLLTAIEFFGEKKIARFSRG